MITNYFRIAWRSLRKNGTFSFINIFGLSIGLASCLLISAYVYSELTYDQSAANANQISRVELHVTGNGSVVDYPNVDWAVGPGMKNAFPEVITFTRLSKGWQPYLRYKDALFKEEHLAMADSNFLRVFSIPLIAGNEKTALKDPNSIVISKAFAQRYFGAEDPMGKLLTVSNSGEFKVTGLIDKVPDNSHFKFEAFVSMSTQQRQRDTWSNVGYYTYLVLHPQTNTTELEKKFRDLVAKYVVPEIQQDMGVSLAEAQKSVDTFVFYLQPLQRIHLYSHTSYEMEPNGDIKYVYIFSALAAFILLLACVNFINLSTATSAKRAREVGVRKVMGSLKTQLIYQFLTESILVAFCAMAFAYLLVGAALPYFNLLTGKTMDFGFFLQPLTLAVVVSGFIVVGFAAGLYPAFFLSSFNMISVLKGNTLSSGKRDTLRSSLVVFQFAVSTALIISTLVVYQQLNFMQNKNLGYDKDQVLVITDTRMLRNNEQVFKEQLLKDSRVINASIARQVPGQKEIGGTQAFSKDQKENESTSEIHIDIFRVDYDYMATLGMELRNGRNFSEDFPSDSSAIVVNETAAKEFGWDVDRAVGKSIVVSGQTEYHVVGVVKDFNYASARQKIGPAVMMLPYHNGSTLVKLHGADIKRFLEDARRQWDAFSPDAPFTYSFLDERFAALYFAEERTGQVFTTFAVIALIIAGLGLFGLSAFSAQQRTKEIGIRKVLGASAQQVLVMLSKQFLVLVLIAFVIAAPLITWAMNYWLEDFAYRITIAWWVFLVAAGLSFFIAFASMCYQVVRAAVANPVNSLKAE